MKHKAFSLILTALLFCSFASLSAKRELFPEVSKWKLNTEFPLYTPENLWDYINGAADGYLSFGFQDLRMAEYKKGSAIIRVEVYRHLNNSNAFGIYASERSPDYNFIPVGVQGYLEGSVLNFYNKDFYVKIQANSSKSKVVDMMREIARQISDNISMDPVSPQALNLFPGQGKVANREAYIASNFLGHEFFNEVFTAAYNVYNEKFRIFITEKSSEEECRTLLEKYFAFTGQDPSLIRPGEMIISDRYNGTLLIQWDGKYIWGVVDTDNHEVAGKYLKLAASSLGL